MYRPSLKYIPSLRGFANVYLYPILHQLSECEDDVWCKHLRYRIVDFQVKDLYLGATGCEGTEGRLPKRIGIVLRLRPTDMDDQGAEVWKQG
jgi:hypothetical protein